MKAAALSLIAGFLSCGDDTVPVAPVSSPEPGVPLFQARIDYPVGGEIRGISSGDLDSDGDIDLVVPMYGDDGIVVLLNNGDGSFQPAIDYSRGLYAFYSTMIAAADLDGDGDCDVVTGNGDASISVFRNHGGALFARDGYFKLDYAPRSMCLSDVDRDGDLDLAVIVLQELRVLMNDGNAAFECVAQYTLGDTPKSLCAADLDGDGDSDLAVSNEYASKMGILLNNGDGSFQDAIYQGPIIWGIYYVAPRQVVASDLDGDGCVDLAVTGVGNGFEVNILLNAGNGTFDGAFIAYDMSAAPSSLVSCDMDGDGDIDLVTSCSNYDSVSLLLNNGDGAFTASAGYATADGPVAVAAVDLDGDGDGDLAVANRYSSSVSIFINGIE